MSGFSAQWLALREPVDHRSVNVQVRAGFVRDLADIELVSIMDLGCGTGSHLRSLSLHLGPRQVWKLVDYDQALLDAARESLSRWAETSKQRGDNLMLHMEGREIEVSFLRADLASGLNAVLDHDCDAVTAAAFFDLVSQDWIARFCTAMAARRRRLYTILSYNGREVWTPAHSADAAILEAFHAHQASDKGFGPAAGPKASEALANGFRQHGYVVQTGQSPWLLDTSDRHLIQELARGSASAIAETGRVDAKEIASWLESHLAASNCEIGHVDLYARPE